MNEFLFCLFVAIPLKTITETPQKDKILIYALMVSISCHNYISI